MLVGSSLKVKTYLADARQPEVTDGVDPSTHVRTRRFVFKGLDAERARDRLNLLCRVEEVWVDWSWRRVVLSLGGRTDEERAVVLVGVDANAQRCPVRSVIGDVVRLWFCAEVSPDDGGSEVAKGPGAPDFEHGRPALHDGRRKANDHRDRLQVVCIFQVDQLDVPTNVVFDGFGFRVGCGGRPVAV